MATYVPPTLEEFLLQGDHGLGERQHETVTFEGSEYTLVVDICSNTDDIPCSRPGHIVDDEDDITGLGERAQKDFFDLRDILDSESGKAITCTVANCGTDSAPEHACAELVRDRIFHIVEDRNNMMVCDHQCDDPAAHTQWKHDQAAFIQLMDSLLLGVDPEEIEWQEAAERMEEEDTLIC